jgi:hypothetical protein
MVVRRGRVLAVGGVHRRRLCMVAPSSVSNKVMVVPVQARPHVRGALFLGRTFPVSLFISDNFLSTFCRNKMAGQVQENNL